MKTTHTILLSLCMLILCSPGQGSKDLEGTQFNHVQLDLPHYGLTSHITVINAHRYTSTLLNKRAGHMKTTIFSQLDTLVFHYGFNL